VPVGSLMTTLRRREQCAKRRSCRGWSRTRCNPDGAREHMNALRYPSPPVRERKPASFDASATRVA
jgi:hypothetical protein